MIEYERVTVTQVICTTVLGAAIGAMVAFLGCVASEMYRDWMAWSIIAPIVIGTVAVLWLRYAPWWMWDLLSPPWWS